MLQLFISNQNVLMCVKLSITLSMIYVIYKTILTFCLNVSFTCVTMSLFLNLSTETYDLHVDIFLIAIIMLL